MAPGTRHYRILSSVDDWDSWNNAFESLVTGCRGWSLINDKFQHRRLEESLTFLMMTPVDQNGENIIGNMQDGWEIRPRFNVMRVSTTRSDRGSWKTFHQTSSTQSPTSNHATKYIIIWNQTTCFPSLVAKT